MVLVSFWAEKFIGDVRIEPFIAPDPICDVTDSIKGVKIPAKYKKM